MKVEIYQEVKTATQSGKNRSKRWVVKPPTNFDSKYQDSLMGWSGSNDTSSQLKFFFDSQEKAVAFARSKGFDYVIKNSLAKKVVPKSYSENFTR